MEKRTIKLAGKNWTFRKLSFDELRIIASDNNQFSQLRMIIEFALGQKKAREAEKTLTIENYAKLLKAITDFTFEGISLYGIENFNPSRREN